MRPRIIERYLLTSVEALTVSRYLIVVKRWTLLCLKTLLCNFSTLSYKWVIAISEQK